MSSDQVLSVRGLQVEFPGGVQALRHVDLDLARGETVAIVGESGAGKSTLALALAGLTAPEAVRGSIRVLGRELVGAGPEALRSLRWTTVALALQGTPFNPVATVRAQVAELYTVHLRLNSSQARRRADEAADAVGFERELLDRYPHELSGGQQRRAMLAMVLALDPALVILDEPTAGLDPHTKRQLLKQLAVCSAERGCAVLVMTHDLADARRMAERCLVLYAGEVMEAGASRDVLGAPAHPYTWALLNAYPVMTTTKDLRPIRGHGPDPRAIPPGCPFHPRCTQAEAVCTEQRVTLAPSRGRLVACHLGGTTTVLSATGVGKEFSGPGGPVRAVRGVSVEVRHAEAVGIIGASGSGKTTLARMLAGHLAPDVGEVRLEGQPLTASWSPATRSRRRRVQLVTQDPWEACSPRLTVQQLVAEPLVVAGARGGSAERVAEMLTAVGLPTSEEFQAARSAELSGGQLQRIVLARALVLGPAVLVADEPTAMLDASEQARLLVLLRELQVTQGLGLVMVSHDLAVVRKVTDRLIVLDAGMVVEEGASHVVTTRPRTAATRRLIEAAPTFDLDD